MKINTYFRNADYFHIWLKNVLLTLITFGYYRVWAKTNHRRYLWSTTTINDEPLEYTGTGWEKFVALMMFSGLLALGFMAMVLVLVVIMAIFGDLGGTDEESFGVSDSVIILSFVVGFNLLAGFGIFRSARYRLSRTQFRGIRFALIGRSRDFAIHFLKGSFLSAITLGFLGGKVMFGWALDLANKVQFGRFQMVAGGNYEDLRKTYLICWLLTLPTLGWSNWYYYQCVLPHYVLNHSKVGGKTIVAEYNPWELFKIKLGNMFLIAFSLGLLSAYAEGRKVRYILPTIRVEGGEELLANLEQSERKSPEFAEGIAEGLDLGF